MVDDLGGQGRNGYPDPPPDDDVHVLKGVFSIEPPGSPTHLGPSFRWDDWGMLGPLGRAGDDWGMLGPLGRAGTTGACWAHWGCWGRLGDAGTTGACWDHWGVLGPLERAGTTGGCWDHWGVLGPLGDATGWRQIELGGGLGVRPPVCPTSGNGLPATWYRCGISTRLRVHDVRV